MTYQMAALGTEVAPCEGEAVVAPILIGGAALILLFLAAGGTAK